MKNIACLSIPAPCLHSLGRRMYESPSYLTARYFLRIFRKIQKFGTLHIENFENVSDLTKNIENFIETLKKSFGGYIMYIILF